MAPIQDQDPDLDPKALKVAIQDLEEIEIEKEKIQEKAVLHPIIKENIAEARVVKAGARVWRKESGIIKIIVFLKVNKNKK
jgi:hypothetical protein